MLLGLERDDRTRVEHRLDLRHVVAVGAGDDEPDGHPVPFGEQVPLGALLAAVRRIRTRRVATEGRLRHAAVDRLPREVESDRIGELGACVCTAPGYLWRDTPFLGSGPCVFHLSSWRSPS
jgi:hypothetical protein